MVLNGPKLNPSGRAKGLVELGNLEKDLMKYVSERYIPSSGGVSGEMLLKYIISDVSKLR
jgi:hypothetical protein